MTTSETALRRIRVAKSAPPEFFDMLLDDPLLSDTLGIPSSVEFAFYSDELQQVSMHLLSNYGIEITRMEDIDIGEFKLSVYSSDMKFTPSSYSEPIKESGQGLWVHIHAKKQSFFGAPENFVFCV